MKYYFSLSLIAILSILINIACSRHPENVVLDNELPEIWPDFTGATFPSNIAAPAFRVKDAGDKFFVEIGETGSDPYISMSSKSGEFLPPLDKWHQLLEMAKGSSIYFRVFIEKKDIPAVQKKDMVCSVATYPVDPYIAYRLLYPGYVFWDRMGIYQRNLADYTEEPVLENLDIDHQCLNCHSFSNWSPETMMIHVRGKKGGTLIRKNGTTKKVIPNCPELQNGATYPAWHPTGDYIAFSANKVQQLFHSKGPKTTEVADLASDMTVYDLKKGKAITCPAISGDEWMETFPNWSPDGKALYFCRAKAYKEDTKIDSIRYDLCKIGFDPSSGKFGEVEVIVNAADNSKSVSFPRVSPDGKWLLFTLSDYGNFSIWHPEADLYLLDLDNHNIRCVDELNSDNVESYHSWSSNGKWIVFSSKRMDGLWARPFIAYFDSSTGRFGVPFPVPQKDSYFYDNFFKTFNVPEFIGSKVTETEDFLRAVMDQ